MFCKSCGKELGGSQKFCTSCGASSPITTREIPPTQTEPFSVAKVASKVNKSRIATILVVVALIGYGAYSNIDQSSIETNNDGITNFDSGNSDQAINQFQEASKNATTDETKLTTLKNLGYVYATDGKNDEALTAFQEALLYTKKDSFEYYLVSAEIAILEGKPNSAYLSFNKAYQMNPNDFQVNNSLAIFHLDLDESAPSYADYPKALTYATKAYSLNNSEITRQNLGIAYFYNEKYDLALSFFTQTNLTQHPYMSLWLGYAYAAKEDVVNAKFYFRKAISDGITVPQLVHDYLASN